MKSFKIQTPDGSASITYETAESESKPKPAHEW